MGAHSQYLSICRNDTFKNYYQQIMMTNRRDFNFIGDKSVVISFSEMPKELIQLYEGFYLNV